MKDRQSNFRILNSAITLEDDVGKGKRFKSRFIQPGLAGYPEEFGNVLVTKETLDSSLNSIIGAPVIINHKDLTAENADDERIGVISDAYYNEDDGWYWCEGIIWDETAQELITDKNWSVSCSYDYLEEDDSGGMENNIHYDREFTKLNFVHLALVNNPRYERANIVFNSKKCIRKEKENDMAILDELKKLVNNAESRKGDERMRTNCEKVDKRRLIDEVGGILKNRVDEEIWRTIIGKIEQIAYNESEAGTADNADDRRRDDEYREECREDFREEYRDDVENRCRNGVKNSKQNYFNRMNEVYNASMQMPETPLYVSTADRLKAAEEYFGK